MRPKARRGPSRRARSRQAEAAVPSWRARYRAAVSPCRRRGHVVDPPQDTLVGRRRVAEHAQQQQR